jgi:8-oxo-dGTP pyrophosphatase MutT (NUDIX family)
MSFFAIQTIRNVSSPKKNPWTTLSRREIYDNAWINLTEYQVLNPAGKPGIYGKVHFKNKAVGIVPVDEEGNTYLVGQYRYTLDDWSWEIPEGGGHLDGDPLEAARRELREETGLTAGRWTLLQRVHLSNSVSDEEGFIYLAEELKPGENALDETEADLKVKKLPLRDAVQMVLEGGITDSLSVIGLLRASGLSER